MQVGRNEPCPCGSGKKYKNCCLRTERAPDPLGDAVFAPQKALDWIGERFRRQMKDALDNGFFADFDDPQALRAALGELSPGHADMLETNIGDWLLFEATLERLGEARRGIQWVLGRDGARLTSSQRAYLQAIAKADLRPYEVVDAEPGVGLRLRDAIDSDAAPRYVHERSASQSLRPGDMLGTRLVDIEGRTIISGAVYALTRLQALAIVDGVRGAPIGRGKIGSAQALQGLRSPVANSIRSTWLGALLDPQIPVMVNHGGEPILLIEDDYDVLDWKALEAALAAQPDVDGSRADSWRRLEASDADSARILGAINPDESANLITLFHRTQSCADAGRPWFERLAGSSVRFRTRRSTDPRKSLGRGNKVTPLKAKRGSAVGLPDIPPEVLGELMGQAIRRSYANWCDEPIPVFGGKTPRQMLVTKAGRERVRYLLGTYEHGEREQAEQQGRAPVSYEFLWEKLALSRLED